MKPAAGNTFNLSNFTKKYMMELILSFITLVLILAAPGFFTFPNILNIFRNVALAGVISFGMTMTIIGGEIDLSVGSSIALSAVLTATITGALDKAGIMPMETAVFVAMGCALVVGMLIGLFNGFIRTRFNIPSFIITLAMLNVIYGTAALISKGFPVTTLPDWYNWIGAGRIFGVFPVPAVWLLIVFAVVFVIMNLTRFGREVYAVGGNPESARLSGINVTMVKIVILVAVQMLAALSGIILSAQVMSGSSTFGRGYEMDVISAVIIGGASLNGGIGKVWGTMIGIVFLGVINNGMTLFGVGDFEKYIVRGLLILFAVLLNTIQVQSLQKAKMSK
ncbi:MAG: ABC transporter permease [Clostridia bacterium]|jgi:ribose/xylose/arabinose/galactoside ABC-type transport system permease subunit|nr:ABC transporter permease [Spirochaetia bacterium]